MKRWVGPGDEAIEKLGRAGDEARYKSGQECTISVIWLEMML